VLRAPIGRLRSLGALAAALAALAGCVTVPPAPPPSDTFAALPPPPVPERIVRRETERRDAATEMLAQAQAGVPRASLLAQRTVASASVGDIPAAARDVQEAARLLPRDPVLRRILTDLLLAAGRTGEADAEIAIARALAPVNKNIRATAAVVAMTRGQWAQAAAALEAVYPPTPTTEVLPYPALLCWVASANAGPASAARARTALERAAGWDGWPAPIAQALLGRIEPAALDAATIHPDPDTQRRWRMEADYYLGEQALLRRDRDAARTRFRATLGSGRVLEYEYIMARSRLAAMGEPVDPASIELIPDRSAPAPATPDGWEWDADSTFDREIARLVRSGAVTRATKRLRERQETACDERHARMLADLLFQTGRSDEALGELRRGLTGAPSDVPVLATIAWTEFVAALRYGVDPRKPAPRNMFAIAFDPLRAKAFEASHQRLAKAREALDKARALAPGDRPLARLQAHVLEHSGTPAPALEIWQQELSANPDDKEARIGAARCMVALGRGSEVASSLASMLAAAPNDPTAHALSAEIARRAGDRKSAQRHEQWAEFGAKLPPGSKLPFTPANVAELQRLQIGMHHVVDDIWALDVPPARTEAIKGWIATKSEHTSSLLAASLWVPEPHGPQPLDAARELVRRGDLATLRTIAQEADNVLAAATAARALIEHGDTDLHDRLLALLWQDDDAFVAGDIRSAMPLANLLDPSFEASPRLSGDRFWPVFGHQRARARAALALASFDTGFAENALRSGIGNPDIALHCHAALFHLTRDRAHLGAIRNALLYGSCLERDRVLELLEGTTAPEAVELVRLVRARKGS
jgi:Flp pilus assembly protein TadD